MISPKLFEGLNNYQVDSIVRSSIWRVVRNNWGDVVKNKSKLEWRRELAKREKLGEGKGGNSQEIRGRIKSRVL